MEAIKKFVGNHPQITSWIVLSIGFLIILFWSARDVDFNTSQNVALAITTILLAGACVWIIGWEDDEEEEVVKLASEETKAKEEDSTDNWQIALVIGY